MVFDGVLRPGDRVRQDDIAARLGVSRIPVREAIIALDREGWLTLQPHRGAFVNGFDRDYVTDHYELYGMLFSLAARRVTERASDDQLEELVQLADQLAGTEGAASFATVNRDYLRALTVAAASRRLATLSRVMRSIVPGNFFEEVPGSMAVQVEGIGATTAHLRRRDATGAATAMTRLMRRQGDAVADLLAARGVTADGSAAAAGA